jgi:glycyl-tRNA synthetase (class II)
MLILVYAILVYANTSVCACTDVAFKFPFGRSELLGVAARGDFDLTAHAQVA